MLGEHGARRRLPSFPPLRPTHARKALARVPFGLAALRRASSTSALLALHAAPHDLATYDFHPSALLHAGILLSWDSLSLHAGAAFSNFGPWASAPGATPAALLALHFGGQEVLGGRDGQPLTSGVFSLWASAGLAACAQLRVAGCVTLLASAGAVGAAYFHLHTCAGGLSSPARQAALAGLVSIAHGAAAPTSAPGLHLISGGTLSLHPAALAAHHISVGVRLAGAGAVGGARGGPTASSPSPPPHLHLSLRLALAGAASLWHAAALLALPAFDALLADGLQAWALFAHHTCAGLALLLGSASHATVDAVRRAHRPGSLAGQRDLLHGHLGWVCALTGCHSLGIYVHNDSALALGRGFDGLADDAIQLRPLAALSSARAWAPGLLTTPDHFVCTAPCECSTADFLVAHIHAFDAHVLVLILCKGPLFAADSRFVAQKAELGFRFPCDGPGRGGSCQVSSWDHVYLALFWLYNLLSAFLFGAFWKLQGPLLRVASDYGLHEGYIQGWLRDFLWAQAAQAVQGYGEARAPYSLSFLLGHFAWALSLMFLFSGRGYWQELIEALLWAHLKLALVPSLQPRALSITQGRAVGVAHFALGGPGATWSFFFSRLLAL